MNDAKALSHNDFRVSDNPGVEMCHKSTLAEGNEFCVLRSAAERVPTGD
ncbi:hypothetical protein [Amycolatopsis arida]|nr:hypothetical protein [Amycolatopsis arida]